MLSGFQIMRKAFDEKEKDGLARCCRESQMLLNVVSLSEFKINSNNKIRII